jgi:hypothetical protein
VKMHAISAAGQPCLAGSDGAGSPSERARTSGSGPLRATSWVGEGVELANQALSLSPAQRALADVVVLIGISADHHSVGEELGLDAVPPRAFAGDLQGIRMDLEGRESHPVETGAPIRMIAKAWVGTQGHHQVLEFGD